VGGMGWQGDDVWWGAIEIFHMHEGVPRASVAGQNISSDLGSIDMVHAYRYLTGRWIHMNG
jgi:hypothetical protein